MLGTFAAALGDFEAAVVVFEDVDEGVGQGVGVFGAHEDAVDAVGDDTGEAFDVAGDDGAAGGHGFEEDDALAFVTGVGGAEDVAAVVVAGEVGVGDEAGEDDVFEAVFAHPV